MAISNHPYTSRFASNPFFQKLFRESESYSAGDREQQWQQAMVHAGGGSEPLRFPIYECLFLINIHSQKLVDLLEEASGKFGAIREEITICQSMIQLVRARTSQSIVGLMNDVEQTEEWLFERFHRNEELELRGPEDAYIEVRRREAERLEKGLPPKIKFLDEDHSVDDADVD